MKDKPDLIIVESPAKTKTLAAFLGPGYQVRASMGHVRDLPKSKLGVDPEQNFAPSYTVIPDRRQIVADLKKAAKECGRVFLATDPDREGEAIAWHLAEALGVKNAFRIEFNEITKRAVQDALQHPHTINGHRVDAQQARRVLDRLVGYKLSPLLWKKVQKNLSAGRVQSVAVRLVVEREREIEAFQSEEYWSVTALLVPTGGSQTFEARLLQIAGKPHELKSQEAVAAQIASLGWELSPTDDGKWSAARIAGGPNPNWTVGEVRRREQRRNPAPPFTTSTLQQEAARKLGFNARRAMQVAQQLYEGVDLAGEHVGLITYMRTDSVNVSQDAQTEAKDYVAQTYGTQFIPPQPRQYRSKAGAQEAHEAIRPTSVFRTPEHLRHHLNSDQFRLYQLVWQRFLASQMASAVFDVTSVDINVLDQLYRATGRVVRFEGFMALYTEGHDDRSRQQQEDDEDEGRRLPELTTGQQVHPNGIRPGQHFTEPPPRYSEATLVKALEEKGIGRPSTYASILSVIVERTYVLLEEKRFRPTPLGMVVNDQLVKHFPNIVSVDFTAEVEQHLDDIATGEKDWVHVLKAFYSPFEQALSRAETEMERVRPQAVPTDINCPDCGKQMMRRTGPYGEFLGCSGYPECRKVLQIGSDGNPLAEGASEDGSAAEVPPCPKCSRPMQLRKGRFGEFWGCTGYPECKTIVDPKKQDLPPPDPDFSMPCPEPNCDGTVTAKRSRRGTIFYGCSNYSSSPKCDYVAWSRPEVDQRCEECGFPMAEKVYRGNSQGMKCTNTNCSTNAGAVKRPARGAASKSGTRATSKNTKSAKSAAKTTTKAGPKSAAKPRTARTTTSAAS